MSENSTEPFTRLPPRANPDSCRSCATSGVAKRRTSSFCWSRNRFFSRLAPMRALSSTTLTGFVQVILGAELDERTTLSRPSSDDVTTTGTSRNARSRASCSSTSNPFISGISRSSSIRSNGSRRSISSAIAAVLGGGDAVALSSRLRVSSSRLTLLSSTTRSRAPPEPGSRTAELRERSCHPRVFGARAHRAARFRPLERRRAPRARASSPSHRASSRRRCCCST